MTTKTDDETKPDEVEPDDDDEQTPDPEAERAANKKLAAENDRMRRRLREADVELERLRKLEEDSKSEHEREIDAIRKEAEEKAEAKYRGLLLQERVKASAAAKRFRDPADVVKLVDLEDLGDDPLEAIDEKLDALAESKPYLIDTGSNGKVPDADQGSRGTPPSGKPKQSPDEWLLGLTNRE